MPTLTELRISNLEPGNGDSIKNDVAFSSFAVDGQLEISVVVNWIDSWLEFRRSVKELIKAGHSSGGGCNCPK